jgi:RNA polymerase sigma-70 factor (ECF subfamily)
VFLLREVFDYEYAEIAAMLGKTEANCRQILRRARQHIDERERRFKVDLATQEQILQQFLAVAATGDINGLMALFSEDIVAYGDGGGKAYAAPRPIAGSAQVARFMIGLAKQFQKAENMTMTMRQVNGQIGLFLSQDNHLITVMTFNFDGENRLCNIYSMVNPDKLQGK